MLSLITPVLVLFGASASLGRDPISHLLSVSSSYDDGERQLFLACLLLSAYQSSHTKTPKPNNANINNPDRIQAVIKEDPRSEPVWWIFPLPFPFFLRTFFFPALAFLCWCLSFLSIQALWRFPLVGVRESDREKMDLRGQSQKKRTGGWKRDLREGLECSTYIPRTHVFSLSSRFRFVYFNLDV